MWADPEDVMNDDVSWSLSGPDAKRFLIANISWPRSPYDLLTDDNCCHGGARTVGGSPGLMEMVPSFEAMDSADGDEVYLVTVTASDGSASKSEDVSITVENTEEYGSVSLTQLVPQEGIAITARLSDPDKGVTGTGWQWYRGGTAATTTCP